MKTTRIALLLSLIWASILAWQSLEGQGTPPPTIPDGVVRQGTLSFDGRATAGDFTGTTIRVTGEMKGGSLTDVRGWVEAPVRTLTTGNGRRDRDLNKSMESDKYPVIRFELTGVNADTVLHGRFTIHGVTREVTMPASVTFGTGSLRVRGTTPLNLKDYRIGGLSKALGMLKMHPEIVVHFDLVFGARPSPSATRRASSPASYTELPRLAVDRRHIAP
jgi:polyisoprenoid-binding protein YceI